MISDIYTHQPYNITIVSDKVCSFSGPVSDGKYIYIFSEPLYNLTDKTSTLIYRANYDGSEMQKIGELKYNESLIYGMPNDGSIWLFGCDDNYLYYSVYARDKNETKNSYTYYRISLKDKNLTPQKLFSTNFNTYSEELCNGYLYFCKRDNPYSILYYRVKLDGTGLTKSDKPFEWRY